jgi:hypothetical protein
MCNSTVDVDIFPAKKSQIMQKQYEFHLKINWQGVARRGFWSRIGRIFNYSPCLTASECSGLRK